MTAPLVSFACPLRRDRGAACDSAQCFIDWAFYNQHCLFVSQLLGEHITSADEEQSPIDVATSNQIYGKPSEAALE